MKILQNAGIFAAFILGVMEQVNFTDEQRVDFAEYHKSWDATEAVGNNNYRTYDVAENGRAIVWRAARNVPANAPAPGVPTNPANWVKVGVSNKPLL